MFHDIKSNCVEESDPEETNEAPESVPFTDSYDIATKRFKSMVDSYVSSLTITQEEIDETERTFQGQNKNKNNLWFEKRKSLLTASNFGKAAKNKVEPSNKLKSILYSNFTTDATQYGIESEAKAVTLYMREMEKNGIDVTFEEIGLLVSKDKPYLGASIDRVVAIKDTHEKWGMEIKSPLSKAGMTIEEARRLKRNHDYYVQTQGQLYCSNLDLKGIILVVYFGESRPLFVEKIYLDNSWISDSLPKIDFFYRRALFPELITRQVQRGKILYLHGGWLPYGQYCCISTGLKMRFQRQL